MFSKGVVTALPGVNHRGRVHAHQAIPSFCLSYSSRLAKAGQFPEGYPFRLPGIPETQHRKFENKPQERANRTFAHKRHPVERNVTIPAGHRSAVRHTDRSQGIPQHSVATIHTGCGRRILRKGGPGRNRVHPESLRKLRDRRTIFPFSERKRLPRGHFRPKSAGFSPHFFVSHLRIEFSKVLSRSHCSARSASTNKRLLAVV